jgi:hypothetical protein
MPDIPEFPNAPLPNMLSILFNQNKLKVFDFNNNCINLYDCVKEDKIISFNNMHFVFIGYEINFFCCGYGGASVVKFATKEECIKFVEDQKDKKK